MLDPEGAGQLGLDGVEELLRSRLPAVDAGTAAAAALMLGRLDADGAGRVTRGQFARHVRKMTAARCRLRPGGE